MDEREEEQMNEGTQNQLTEAYTTGRRDGFGIAALALGVVTYMSLLGAEKAILAIVLGALALRGAAPRTLPRRLGIAAICLGAVFIVTIAVVLVVFRDKVAEFFALLQKLS
jgi:hypothetical protein